MKTLSDSLKGSKCVVTRVSSKLSLETAVNVHFSSYILIIPITCYSRNCLWHGVFPKDSEKDTPYSSPTTTWDWVFLWVFNLICTLIVFIFVSYVIWNDYKEPQLYAVCNIHIFKFGFFLTQTKWCIFASIIYAIVRSNDGWLVTWPLGTTFSEIWITTPRFAHEAMNLKLWWLCCLLGDLCAVQFVRHMFFFITLSCSILIPLTVRQKAIAVKHCLDLTSYSKIVLANISYSLSDTFYDLEFITFITTKTTSVSVSIQRHII